ncbi:hypothetical protein [Neisseria sp.]|uniref:hypothetical protein n=1 Tax=Neisseria sp. TaxID=192066 RepID=UPI0035A11581
MGYGQCIYGENCLLIKAVFGYSVDALFSVIPAQAGIHPGPSEILLYPMISQLPNRIPACAGTTASAQIKAVQHQRKINISLFAAVRPSEKRFQTA